MPDKTIFTATVEYNFDTLSQRLRELAFLNKGLVITLTDERQTDSKTNEAKRTEFKYNGGIAEFIKHLNRGKQTLHDKPIYMEADKDRCTSKSASSTTTPIPNPSSVSPTTSTPSMAARIFPASAPR